MGWLTGKDSESGNVRTLTKGFFESEASFAMRVRAAGNTAPPAQHRQAKRTLENLEKKRKAEQDKKRRAEERKRKAEQDKKRKQPSANPSNWR